MERSRLLTKDFVLACVACFLYFGSFYLILPTLPQYVLSLGGTTSEIGLAIGIFSLVSVIIRPNFGRFVDTHGRKRFMILGAGVWTLLFSLYGQVHTIVPLCLLRAAHGVAHGAYMASSYAYVADLAPPDRRGEAMGIYGVSNVVAMALFPAVGSAMISGGVSFPSLFILSTCIAAGAFLSVCFIGEVSPGRREGGKASIMAALRHRPVLVASLTLFAATTVYGTMVTFLPVYAPSRGLKNVGVFFSTYAVFTLVSRVIAGKLSDRYGRRRVVLPFMTVVAVAVFLLPLLHGLFLLVLIGACFGLGFGAFMPALNAFVVDETAPAQRASALAFYTSFMDMGITAGALVLGVAGQYWGYETMYCLGGFVVLLGVLLFALHTRTPRPAGAQGTERETGYSP